MIVSIGLSIVALAFTVIVSVKLRTMSLLLLNVRTVKAANMHFDFFETSTTTLSALTSAVPSIVVLFDSLWLLIITIYFAVAGV